MAKLRANVFFKTFIEFLGMTLGAAIAAFALEEVLVSNTILDGGVNGVSIIINKLSGISLGLLIFLLNIPFIYVGYKNIGSRFLVKSLFSMGVFAIFVELLDKTSIVVTNDIILAMIYGGVLLGIGVGLIIKCGGCNDGTESIAIVISKKTSLTVGQVVLICNLVIFGCAGFIFGIDRALYSLLTYFITFNVIDLVNEGLEKGKAVMIIANNGDCIAKSIYEKLGRTCTYIDGYGLLSGAKNILYVVVTRIEISEIKRIVADEDQSAFVTITDVSEIVGKHIKSTKEIDNLKISKKINKNKK